MLAVAGWRLQQLPGIVGTLSTDLLAGWCQDTPDLAGEQFQQRLIVALAKTGSIELSAVGIGKKVRLSGDGILGPGTIHESETTMPRRPLRRVAQHEAREVPGRGLAREQRARVNRATLRLHDRQVRALDARHFDHPTEMFPST